MSDISQSNDLVSVVIPTYNRAALIVDVLDSVACQDYRPLEVIVVDDGSTDDTSGVVDDWTFSNESDDLSVRYVFQENQGGNIARNAGIDLASGSFVAFLDSDDTWHLSKLKKQIAAFKNDAVGGVYCGLQHVDLETGQVTETPSRAYPQGMILEQMLVHDVTSPTSCWVVRKDVFDTVGVFDVELQARQDWDMWIRVSADYEIACVPEVLVNYREHTGERTVTDPQKEIDAYERIMEKYEPLRDTCSFSIRQQAKAAYFRRMGRVQFHYRKSWMQAFTYYLKAIFAWPFELDSYAALAGLFIPASLRQNIHKIWNKVFGGTRFAIRSH